jgi:hypothetical protein
MRKNIPSLYGIKHSNRNFSDKYYWGKNQFNSSFPIALSCYLRDKGISANYIFYDNHKTNITEITFDDIFATKKPNASLKFLFEHPFEPFNDFVEDSLEKIDVIIVDNETQEPLRPLEIKLTTLPDDTTSKFPEAKYGSEIVIRSPTMRYVALTMSAACQNERNEIQKIFHPVAGKIRDWGNVREMVHNRDAIFRSLEAFLVKFQCYQQPLLLQPIWKTIGKEPRLATHCLDIFVWSNFALTRLFMDALIEGNLIDRISRPQRSALRLARFLYEFSRSGKVYQEPIYDGMTFDTLNDKEFSVSGSKTNPYMACERLLKPRVTKDEIKNIVMGGGQKWLSPERRFDSILFFSEDIFR